MRYIELPSNRRVIVDDEDYEWLNGLHSWQMIRGYAILYEEDKGKLVRTYMHRLIMSPPVGMDTDHINGDKLDNRRSNLRICTRRQNLQNQKKSTKRKYSSRYKGVVHKRNRWRAYIRASNKFVNLGSYKEEVEAAKAYNEAALSLYGEYANLNILK